MKESRVQIKHVRYAKINDKYPDEESMANYYEINGLIPVVPEGTYVHPQAVLIGDVVLGQGCYIGPFASLRGDFGRIEIGDGANVQDNCTIHSFPGQGAIVEENGHIGHGAILHGCHIGENCLIGMNSVVMDNVELGANSIIAAQSFVKAGMVIPARSMVAGSPAKILRAIRDEELGWKKKGTEGYQALARACLTGLKEVRPLKEVETNRKAEFHPELSSILDIKLKGK